MSKSLNNSINISSILERYTAAEFRVLCLLNHYRNSLVYLYDFHKLKLINILKIISKDYLNCFRY